MPEPRLAQETETIGDRNLAMELLVRYLMNEMWEGGDVYAK